MNVSIIDVSQTGTVCLEDRNVIMFRQYLENHKKAVCQHQALIVKYS